MVGIGVISDCCEFFVDRVGRHILCLGSVFSPVFVSQFGYSMIKHVMDLLAICRFFCNRCLFFGDVSCKRDPSTYLSYVFAIYDYYQKEYGISVNGENPCNIKLPLIVNTPGWVKGKLSFFCC